MRTHLVSVCCFIAVLVSGCATMPGFRQAGTLQKVRHDAAAEVSDAVHTTRQQVS